MFVSYRNGNYRVFINLEDGTKIRWNDEDNLTPSRPESMDVKITNRCPHGCSFCHENSKPDGAEATYEMMEKFTASVMPYTEIAVGGGSLMVNPPHTEYFLRLLKEAKAIPSITLRQEDYINNMKIIDRWVWEELVYGIGVSLSNSYDPWLIPCLKAYPRAVVHAIAGIFTEDDYDNLKGHDLNLLLLGYKQVGRGRNYLKKNVREIADNQLMLEKHFADFEDDFKCVAFDNAALNQLNIKKRLPLDKWNTSYLGEEGQYTYYVNLVEQKFAINSSSNIKYNIDDHTCIEMFDFVRRVSGNATD